MTLFARVAASAVLVALFVGVQASAAPPSGPGWGIARLEPARMFNPNAESLFAALTPATHSMSPIEVVVFNVDNAPDAQVALRDDESTFAPHGTGFANVNLAIAHVRAAYTPSSQVQAPAPHLADVQLNAPSNAAFASNVWCGRHSYRSAGGLGPAGAARALRIVRLLRAVHEHRRCQCGGSGTRRQDAF